ncbi:MAG: SURF1 family protein [Nitrosomonas sp.]|nr:SURF1 family protein [Nitrosomonas sp.]
MLAIALFIRLGYWQLSRAEEKEIRFSQLETYARQPAIAMPTTLVDLKSLRYRRAEVRGYFVPQLIALLDNKVHNGTVGYHVLMPLRIENSDMHVLVNRGWIPAGANRMHLPEISTSDEYVRIVGTVVSPDVKTIALSENQVSGKVWQSFEFSHYQEMTDIELQPLMLLQHEDTNLMADGLIRKWERPDSGSSRNIGYAVQWFSLAAVTLLIYIVLNVKRKNSEG